MRAKNTWAVLAVLVALLAGCGGQADSTATTASLPSSMSDPQERTSTPPSDQSAVTSDAPDYAALIATVEDAMAETAYEGAALADVEVFVATSELFCDLLAEGMSADEIVVEYLETLAADGAVDLDEDDGYMTGVLLGASVQVVCPEYSDAVSGTPGPEEKATLGET